jgi:hypothetical protein
VTNLVTIQVIWLLVGAALCIIIGYSIGRGSGKEHTVNRLTQQYRRGLEQTLNSPQSRNRGKKR